MVAYAGLTNDHKWSEKKVGGVSCHIKQHRVLRPHSASKIYAHTVKILYMGAAALYTVYTATQNEEEEKKKKNVAQVGKRPLGLFS